MKILFIGVNTNGLVMPIVEEMRRQSHDVTYLENGEVAKYDYLHKSERLTNSIAKGLFGRNLKKERRWLATDQFLNGFLKDRFFDLTILTNPDIYTREHLVRLKEHSGRLVCHLWDSADRHPGNLKYINQFDKVMSFDPKDIKKYGFQPVTNYYHNSMTPLAKDREIQGDLFGIFSFDRERYAFILRFLDANPELKTRIIILADHKRKIRQANDPRVEVVTSFILGEALMSISSGYRAILDVGYATQQGLSFRFFDSLGYEQKLVTNNQTVKQYPFYNPDNIFCVNNSELFVSKEFFNTPYQSLSDDIKRVYCLDTWVENLLAAMMN